MENINGLTDLMEEKMLEKAPKTIRRKTAVLCMLITAVVAVLITLGILYLFLNRTPFGKTLQKLYRLNNIAAADYIGELDYNELDNALMKSYVSVLDDDYAFYQKTESAKAVTNSFEGISYGIGISVVYDNTAKNIYVRRVYEKSPAAVAGLQFGDRILQVDGKSVEELGYQKAVSAIKKQKGEQTVLLIQRGDTTLSLTAVCDDYTEQSVFYRMIGQQAYVEITGFNAATVDQFKGALDFVKTKQAQGVIFDLRNNGGGTVDSAAKMLDMLLGECDIISVEYANHQKKVLYRSDAEKLDLPMTVIVNENTASAAELFTAALRDEAAAKIIGHTTYGKGIMQHTYFFKDDSCVRMTVAHFFPPSGVSFHKEGIKPDVTVEVKENVYYVPEDNDPFIQAALQTLAAMEK